MVEKNGDDKGFVVKDRRMFDKGGEVREEDRAAEEKRERDHTRILQDTGLQKDAGAADEGGEESYVLPEITFANFVMSLHTSALFHFGEFPDPNSGEKTRNLPAARQTIEILDVLKTKTAGNLDNDESNLLEGVLYDLKMRFVRESGTP